MKLHLLFVALIAPTLWSSSLVQAFRLVPVPGILKGGVRFSNRESYHHVGAALRCRRVIPIASMMEIECDVAIVGGGPAGCTCALYTSRAKHKTVVIDKSPAIGALARTELIANYPGVETEMNGQVLLDMMRNQAVQYGTEYHKAQVYLVEVDGDRKIVHTPDLTVRARALVLATGAMGREPYFKGEGEYLGQGVSYCATCDAPFYQGSEVAVVGNNPEAIEEAEHLTKFASTIHWITQADLPMDNPDVQHMLEQPNVRHWSHSTMLSIEGDGNGVTGVKVKSRDDGTAQLLPVEGVFVYISGSKPITDFLDDAVELDKDGGVKTNDDMMTSADGVFAVGDIRNTPFKQVVVAASDGCIAAMAIGRYLKGSKKIKVDWVHK